MSTTSLNGTSRTVNTEKDGVIVRYIFETIPGGKSLDTSGFAPDVIPAGHPVIVDDSTGNIFKPLSATAPATSRVATLGTVVGGAGYTNGSYIVPAVGGTGTGALLSVTVASNVVSAATVAQGGDGYTVGDVLTSPLIPGGSGWSVPVATTGTTTAALGTLPTGYSYIGVVGASILTSRPMASVVTRGAVNPAAAVYPYTSILTAIKAALPRISFQKD